MAESSELYTQKCFTLGSGTKINSNFQKHSYFPMCSGLDTQTSEESLRSLLSRHGTHTEHRHQLKSLGILLPQFPECFSSKYMLSLCKDFKSITIKIYLKVGSGGAGL